jgi:hypothetical protein
MHRLARWSFFAFAWLAHLAASAVDTVSAAELAGAATPGGLVAGTRIVHVTTLGDSGPGSLRAAVAGAGPRVVVFDVGGVIQLKSDLKIFEPFQTIAGQTAPAPGISLHGASLRIRNHDIIVEHIAVRPGPSDSAKVNDNLDAIGIDGSGKAGHDSYNVLLQNVSASWAVDEVVQLWYPTTRNVTVRNSIISEGLRNAGHPKGEHSMGLIVGRGVQDAEITGNLFASSMFRNPVIATGASAVVANNFIANPGFSAVHVYSHSSPGTTRASFVANVVEAGPDTKHADIAAVQLPPDMPEYSPDARIYVRDNVSAVGSDQRAISNRGKLGLLDQPEIAARTWKMLPADKVKAWVLRYAGTRPGARDAQDVRLLAALANGTGRIIDMPSQLPAVAEAEPTHAVADVPDAPFTVAAGIKKTRLAAWLCLQHLQVGGPGTPECPEEAARLRQALAGPVP